MVVIVQSIAALVQLENKDHPVHGAIRNWDIHQPGARQWGAMFHK